MNHEALKTLIDSEPANATRTDAEVAGWLNESVAGPLQPITSASLLKWAAKYGVRAKLKAVVANASLDAGLRSLCDDALLMLERDSTVLDLADADMQTMVGVLQAATIINADQAATLQALAATTRRRGAAAGLTREADFADVQTARSL